MSPSRPASVLPLLVFLVRFCLKQNQVCLLVQVHPQPVFLSHQQYWEKLNDQYHVDTLS